METAILKQIITLWGPLGLGWVLAGYLMYRNTELARSTHQALVTNTAAITKITVLIDERIPRS